jgi:G6PDH family F420-dependent oxidoreductase
MTTPRLRLGFSLSSEEHPAPSLVEQAVAAERAGFHFALISDHFHPWIDAQGESPFVWTVIGAIAARTERLEVGTAVTCPRRMHPALVAQAAATTAQLMPGRFVLGLGTGENLNEHILGERWPTIAERRAMLEESIEVIRDLWKGGRVSHRGRWVTVEDARIYSLPETPPRIAVAAAGRRSAELAGHLGDALIAVKPDASVVEAFDQNGGRGKRRYGQLHVCWAASEAAARRTAYEWWPNGAIASLGSELRLPRDFEEVALMLSEDDVAQGVLCGPDPQRYVDRINDYVAAGFDHVYLHQVGSDQEGFVDFARRELIPRLDGLLTSAA